MPLVQASIRKHPCQEDEKMLLEGVPAAVFTLFPSDFTIGNKAFATGK